MIRSGKYARMVQLHLRILVAELKRINPNINLVSLGEQLAAEAASILVAARLAEPEAQPELHLWNESSKEWPTVDYQPLCVANIVYEPEPKDWCIEWVPFYESEKLVADFWNIDERPPPRIPRAWPDEED